MNNQRTLATQSDLAHAVGVSQSTVARDLARQGCPLGRPPWSAAHVDAYVGWRAERAKRSADGDHTRQERDRWLARRYRSKALEIERRLACVEKMRADAAEVVAHVRERLLEVPSEVAPRCIGKSVATIEEVIDAASRKALDELANWMEQRAGEQP